MMSLKRSIDNLADIDEDKHGIELHFGMEELSPMKTARSGIPYYHGQANDGTCRLHLVGFDKASQSQIAEIVEKQTPVKATNCNVKRN